MVRESYPNAGIMVKDIIRRYCLNDTGSLSNSIHRLLAFVFHVGKRGGIDLEMRIRLVRDVATSHLGQISVVASIGWFKLSIKVCPSVGHVVQNKG